MDFLSQIPMALLGRPATGVVDFASGAIGGLATGDSGSYSPGILSSLGRLGMMAMAVKQSKDPTALLKVKDYFDRQDAQKQQALSDPTMQNATPEQFEQAHGFRPPTTVQMQGGPGAYTGGRASVKEVVQTNPIDPRVAVPYDLMQNRLARSKDTSNPVYADQILTQGASAEEKTLNSDKLTQSYLEQHPEIDPRAYMLTYDHGADGSIIAGIAPRRESLHTMEDIQSGAASTGMDPNQFERNVQMAGVGFRGEPLYDLNYMSRQRQGISDKMPEPVKASWYGWLQEHPGDTAGAGKAASQTYMDLHGGDRKKGKTTFAEDLAQEQGLELDATAREQINVLGKSAFKPEAPMDKMVREGNKLPDPAEEAKAKIQEILAPFIAKRDLKEARKAGLSDSGDYDISNARAAGLGPSEEEGPNKGHYPSRVPNGPNEGLILKMPWHKTFYKEVEADKEKGYKYYAKGGRLYSFDKDPGEGYEPVPYDQLPQGPKGEEKAAEKEQEKPVEKRPAPKETPQGSNIQPGSRAPESPKPSPGAQPRPRVSATQIKGKEQETADELDADVKKNGFAVGTIKEMADTIQNTDLNVLEQGRYLEEVINKSKSLSPAQRKEALKSIPSFLGVKGKPKEYRLGGG